MKNIYFIPEYFNSSTELFIEISKLYGSEIKKIFVHTGDPFFSLTYSQRKDFELNSNNNFNEIIFLKFPNRNLGRFK